MLTENFSVFRKRKVKEFPRKSIESVSLFNVPGTYVFNKHYVLVSTGGVEDTRLEAKAKDQGHRRKCSKKKRKKDLQKFFFRRSLLEETKKRSL